MNAPTSERWRSGPWQSKADAERYIRALPADKQAKMAEKLGLELQVRPVLSPSVVNPAPRQVIGRPDSTATSGSITLYLRWGPSINHYWRSVLIPCKPTKPGAPPYRVQVMISQEGRDYRREVRQRIEALRTWGPVAAPPGSRLAVTLTLHGPNRRSFDIDNRIKAVLDALTHAAVWADDALVD